MGNNIKNVGIVSIATVGSRVLGLARDVLMFAVLGAGVWSSAFILAFTLPNLFRRLLGEGALTSALVPVFSKSIAQDGESPAFEFLNQTMTRLAVVLLGLVSLGVVFMLLCVRLKCLPERWLTGAQLSALLFPYMIFICMAAVVAAALQVLSRFTLAALGPVLLNLAMIGALGIGIWNANGAPDRIVLLLCFGVLLGGFLQMVLPAIGLGRVGWRPRIDFRQSSRLNEMWALFLPGLAGAAILQLNILVSRLLSYSLGDSAASILYLGSRLMELPLGVFTIAIITVYFPILANAVAQGGKSRFESSFREGLRLILTITIPAGAGLIVLAKPILNLLFNWGAFGENDVNATIPVLVIYAIGLPLYSVATYATRGFHANKDMKSPVRIACVCLIVNALSGLVLMQFWGAAGLAVGNIFSAGVQAFLLMNGLKASGVSCHYAIVSVAKISSSAIGMALVCYLGFFAIFSGSSSYKSG